MYCQVHEPSFCVALGTKLNAFDNVQPGTWKMDDPSSWFAAELYAWLRLSVQPRMLHVPSSTTAKDLKFKALEFVHPKGGGGGVGGGGK